MLKKKLREEDTLVVITYFWHTPSNLRDRGINEAA